MLELAIVTVGPHRHVGQALPTAHGICRDPGAVVRHLDRQMLVIHDDRDLHPRRVGMPSHVRQCLRQRRQEIRSEVVGRGGVDRAIEEHSRLEPDRARELAAQREHPVAQAGPSGPGRLQGEDRRTDLLNRLVEVVDRVLDPGHRSVGISRHTAEIAYGRIPATNPHVAVLDVRLPDGDGVEVCREIRSKRPEIACLMLTSYADDEALFAAIMAGAAGFVLKQVRGTDLIDGIRRVAAGESLLDPSLTARALERLRTKPEDEGLSELTPQERRILELIGEGMANRQIGEEMFLAEKTVTTYVSNLLAKLGMNRRTEAAAYAARLDERRRHDTR